MQPHSPLPPPRFASLVRTLSYTALSFCVVVCICSLTHAQDSPKTPFRALTPNGLQRLDVSTTFHGHQKSEIARKKLSGARTLMDEGELDRATALYRGLLRTYPELWWLHKEYGYALAWFGSYSQALPHLQKVVQNNPVDVEATVGLAMVHDALGQNTPALRLYRRVVLLQPNHHRARFNLGRLEYATKDLTRAESTYRDLLERFPKDWKALNNLGLILLEREQPTAALPPLRRALKLRPKDPGVLYNIGRSHAARGSLQTALRFYDRALAFWGPDDIASAALHYARGNALFGLKKYDLAIAAFKRAIELDGQFTGAYLNLGASLANVKRYPEAIEAFQRAVEQNPRRADVYQQIALCFINDSNLDQAIETLRTAQSIDHENANTYLLLAEIHESRGEHKKRLEALQKACVLGVRKACRASKPTSPH